MEFKEGDIVIGIKTDPEFPETIIVEKIGIVTQLYEKAPYPYLVEFKEKLILCKEHEIKRINSLKLKALLKD